MAKRASGPDIRTAQPLRSLARRFLFLVFLGGAVALMVLGRTDPEAFERARTTVTDIAAPVLDTLARPIAAIRELIQQGNRLLNLYEDNSRLRQEVKRLKQWQTVARWLEIENAQMRDLLAFERQDVEYYVTGRVIGTGGTFVRSLLLNVGTQDGIRKGQPAVTGDGLIGRVAETGQRSSRVLLITDLNSRVPVRIQGAREGALLAGDNTALPRLIYGAADSNLRPGLRVVTSGDADAFPPGLPVGVIVSADENGVRVQPYAGDERPNLVRLMEFGLNGILGQGLDVQN